MRVAEPSTKSGATTWHDVDPCAEAGIATTVAAALVTTMASPVRLFARSSPTSLPSRITAARTCPAGTPRPHSYRLPPAGKH